MTEKKLLKAPSLLLFGMHRGCGGPAVQCDGGFSWQAPE